MYKRIMFIFGNSFTQSLDFQVEGHFKGKIGDLTSQELSEIEEETLLGKSFLVSELFCQHSWG